MCSARICVAICPKSHCSTSSTSERGTENVNDNGLYAGAGRTSINPPLGIKTVGFSAREGFVDQIESDLTSTAVVFSANGSKMAILALDLCNPSVQMVTDWRNKIAEAIGASPSHVMVNLSHTHSGPPFPGRTP